MDGAASDDEEISALGASPARPRAGGSAASSPTLSLPESFSNLGGGCVLLSCPSVMRQ